MIPTGRLLLLLGGPGAVSLLAVLWPARTWWVLVADALLLAVALFDALAAARARLQLQRRAGRNLSVGTSNRFELLLTNRGRRAVHVEVNESFPATMEVQGLPSAGWIDAGATRVVRYRVVPQRRGAYQLKRTYVRVRSPLGLWRRQITRGLDHRLKVLPNVKILSTYALLARRNRIDLLGFRLARGRGSDVEFDRLREYQPDDDYRRIDPFASARQRKLITREYQVSRNQNIFFMLDCGRPMSGESGGLSNLDHAINATLMLGYVALEHGDNVGLLAFDERIRTVVPVTRHARAKTTLLHALYDLRVSGAEPDYEGAFGVVQRQVRQRSLVVLLSNVMDGASFELLSPQLRLLTRRHLPLVLLLKDQDLFELAEAVPRDTEELFTVGAAAALASWREGLAAKVRSLGALALDVTPHRATPELINAYLRIKADQLL